MEVNPYEPPTIQDVPMKLPRTRPSLFLPICLMLLSIPAGVVAYLLTSMVVFTAIDSVFSFYERDAVIAASKTADSSGALIGTTLGIAVFCRGCLMMRRRPVPLI